MLINAMTIGFKPIPLAVVFGLALSATNAMAKEPSFKDVEAVFRAEKINTTGARTNRRFDAALSTKAMTEYAGMPVFGVDTDLLMPDGFHKLKPREQEETIRHFRMLLAKEHPKLRSALDNKIERHELPADFYKNTLIALSEKKYQPYVTLGIAICFTHSIQAPSEFFGRADMVNQIVNAHTCNAAYEIVSLNDGAIVPFKPQAILDAFNVARVAGFSQNDIEDYMERLFIARYAQARHAILAIYVDSLGVEKENRNLLYKPLERRILKLVASFEGVPLKQHISKMTAYAKTTRGAPQFYAMMWLRNRVLTGGRKAKAQMPGIDLSTPMIRFVDKTDAGLAKVAPGIK